ncbi:uncharacterized protein PHALS_14878 [Plasmopara halstedii]|uniref:Uncharacterized protein n=1 Tax=Plasmopara halstedii TaxID=4781 RepID=A0A0P1AWZ7_PLAHL|nr:uncharacterized protein PHALS_14878 [Plasmopara halstedii]CEG46149.1 hypothetical protein PHALS_14878 [Plasmopara halstedii]|eukprot:XP_024582518.1 hypothetical protein PHALS_14878 [Plasmopara halstedii]
MGVPSRNECDVEQLSPKMRVKSKRKPSKASGLTGPLSSLGAVSYGPGFGSFNGHICTKSLLRVENALVLSSTIQGDWTYHKNTPQIFHDAILMTKR